MPCRIHSTLPDRDKNVMSRQSVFFSRRPRQADDIDGTNLLIYDASLDLDRSEPTR